MPRSTRSIRVVGIGSGGRTLTLEAVRSIREADVVIGYRRYVDMVRQLIEGEVLETEVDEIQRRVDQALSQGGNAVVLSSGDPMVFGMGSRIAGVEGVSYVPGVTAVSLAASVLGWPLDDYAVVSVSTYSKSLEEVLTKLSHAIEGRFRIGIYNMNPKTRLGEANAVVSLLKRLASTWEYGIVRNAMREGQSSVKGRIPSLTVDMVDMDSLLLVRPP